MTISHAVRALRSALGDTQQQFAARTGWAVSTVVRYERSRLPRGRALAKLEKLAAESGNHELARLFADALRRDLGWESSREKMLRDALKKAIICLGNASLVLDCGLDFQDQSRFACDKFVAQDYFNAIGKTNKS